MQRKTKARRRTYSRRTRGPRSLPVLLLLGALCAIFFYAKTNGTFGPGNIEVPFDTDISGFDARAEEADALGSRSRWEQESEAPRNGEGILLVNWQNPLPEGYMPDELVNLYEQERSFQLSASDILLERAAFEAADRMFAQAESEGVSGFILTSGYRTAQKQRELYEAATDGTAAAPGTSEHQTGLAFDVTARRDSGGFEDTPQYRWLAEHCWEYGFILRYPNGKEAVTGIPYEPWHYRYVGEETALRVKESGVTLEEYLNER